MKVVKNELNLYKNNKNSNNIDSLVSNLRKNNKIILLIDKILNNAKKCSKMPHIHFVGIGGISMSSLAIWCKNNNFFVSGSDCHKSEICKKLQAVGIEVSYKQNEINLKNVDIVVYSNACENCGEIIFAKNNNILALTRAEFLSYILNKYEKNISVAGAHGKTTTTALIYQILKQDMQKPSLHLGGNLTESEKSYDYNNGKTIVCEACEYKDSFLNFFSTVGVILNVGKEHLDYFKNISNINKSFNQFASQSNVLFCNNKIKIPHKNKITFGYKNADYVAKNLKMQEDGTYTFDCICKDNEILNLHINLIGKHNVLNALCAIAVAKHFGCLDNSIKTALSTFCGVERRFQKLHKTKFIYHDYAHHPEEIATTLKEINKFYKGKLLVVFQPHTYSRTKTLMSEFIKAFCNVKNVIILKTYSAREKYDKQGDAKTLAKNINAKYFNCYKKAGNYISDKINKNFGIIFLGAGDIYNFAKNLVKKC